MIVKVADIDVKKVKFNPANPGDRIKDVAELKAQIKRNGQQVPIHAVKQNGGYMVIAGNRRLKAMKELKQEWISAIIHDELTSEAQALITYSENVGRKDLSLSQEAHVVGKLLDAYDGDEKAVATILGIPASQVKAHVLVSTMTKSWQEKIEQDPGPLTLAHLAVIARFSHEIQDAMIEDHRLGIDGWNGTIITVKELRKRCENLYLNTLNSAIWDRMITGIGGKPPCEGCLKRSDAEQQTELWDVETTGKHRGDQIIRCLDRKCYLVKQKASVVKKLEDQQKIETVIPIATTFKDAYNAPIDQKKVKVIGAEVERAKKSDKDAVKGLIVSGPQAGKTVYVNVQNEDGDTKSKEQVEKEAAPKVKTLKERRLALHGIRLKSVLEDLCDFLREFPALQEPSDERILRLVAVFGTNGCNRWHDPGAIKLYETIEMKKVHKEIVKDIIPVLIDRLKSPNGSLALAREKEGQFVSKLFNFGWDCSLKIATEAKPEPKSWKNLKADGTPK